MNYFKHILEIYLACFCFHSAVFLKQDPKKYKEPFGKKPGSIHTVRKMCYHVESWTTRSNCCCNFSQYFFPTILSCLTVPYIDFFPRLENFPIKIFLSDPLNELYFCKVKLTHVERAWLYSCHDLSFQSSSYHLFFLFFLLLCDKQENTNQCCTFCWSDFQKLAFYF